jgi:nucleotide-binding universal stress UspA family protein
MDMTLTSTERVIVGVDGSPGSITALRTAAEQARCRNARLCVVHVRPRRGLLRSQLGGFYGPGGVTASSPLLDRPLTAADPDTDTRRIVDAALEQALGPDPNDLVISRLDGYGKPGRSLVGWAWRANELLVLGKPGGGRWRRPLHRSTGRYCAAHAHGPVIIVRADDEPPTTRRLTWLKALLSSRRRTSADPAAPAKVS